MGFLALFAAVFVLSTRALFSGTYSWSNSLGHAIPGRFQPQTSWAQYSPFFPVKIYEGPPRHCKVIQLLQLQRHGARFPTSGASVGIRNAVSKLLTAANYTDPRVVFLRTYRYELGEDDLVAFGAHEAQQAGRVHYNRYSDLVDLDNLPFVRASSSKRVVQSAANWTAGFSIANRQVYNPKLSVILNAKLNDTLHNDCPNAGDSDLQTEEWLSIYAPPIAARLNRQVPGANLASADVYRLMSLCPFESVYKESFSKFCALFSDAEFEQFEYSGDLDKYYNTGYGQLLGRVQGVGYVNELIARLTGKPVRDHTQTNHTLTSSPITFPLNRSIYADFSHDNQMIAIYSAIGLFPQAKAPDPSLPDPSRNWLASQLVPFSAQMVTEKVLCGQEEYVRIFVNDALQPLRFCGANGDGMCELGAFVESQAYAQSDGSGDFERCFN
ncbi:acid phosphatase [Tricholoma matsutake]|nr:acid phosphatase [Tricholoma matsutake 945]